MSNRFYKIHDDDKVWWVRDTEHIGIRQFSFDKKKIYNLFRDYPSQLTIEEKTLFDKENPRWKAFFGA